MTCPKCGAGMAAVTAGPVEIDRCTACAGLWFDVFEDDDVRRIGAVAAVDTGDPAVGRRHDAQARVLCPRCQRRMVPMVDRQQRHVWFESCPACFGRFYDAGEFTEVSRPTLLSLYRSWRARERPLG